MQTFRRPPGQRIAIALLTALLIGTSVLVCGAAGLIWRDAPGWGLAMTVIAGINVALTFVMIREAIGQWQVRIGIDADGVDLCLPPGRGHARLTRVDRRVAFEAIEGVETRRVMFRTAGLATTQRSWAIRLRDGTRIELGADRDLQAPFFGPAAEAIAGTASVPIRDMGAVDGRPGFLLVWGASQPEWNTPSLTPDAIGARDRAASLAWRIAAAAAMLAVIARVLAEFL